MPYVPIDNLGKNNRYYATTNVVGDGTEMHKFHNMPTFDKKVMGINLPEGIYTSEGSSSTQEGVESDTENKQRAPRSRKLLPTLVTKDEFTDFSNTLIGKVQGGLCFTVIISTLISVGVSVATTYFMNSDVVYGNFY